jgi:hypothetical protein
MGLGCCTFMPGLSVRAGRYFMGYEHLHGACCRHNYGVQQSPLFSTSDKSRSSEFVCNKSPFSSAPYESRLYKYHSPPDTQCADAHTLPKEWQGNVLKQSQI